MDNQILFAIIYICEDILDSSSDDDESLDELMTVIVTNRKKVITKRPKVRLFIENVVHKYNDVEFRKHFR